LKGRRRGRKEGTTTRDKKGKDSRQRPLGHVDCPSSGIFLYIFVLQFFVCLKSLSVENYRNQRIQRIEKRRERKMNDLHKNRCR